MTLLQVDVRGAGRLRVDDVRDRIALQVSGFESERCDVVANEVHRERHRRAARFVGEIAALTRERGHGAGHGIGFDQCFLEIGSERFVRLRGQDALRGDECRVVVDARVVVTLGIGDAL